MRIDVYADFICPWCYIGFRRVRLALAARPRVRALLVWHPFQLNPAMPKGGLDRRTYLALRFGGRDRVQQIHDLIEDSARSVGLALDFESIARQPNTLDAHRLMRFAAGRDALEPGGLDRLAEALFDAYFQRGVDLGDRSNLVALAATAGLPRAEVAGYLASDADLETIRAEDLRARRMGIDGVPCFVLAGRYAIAGAQEPEAFLPLFDIATAA